MGSRLVNETIVAVRARIFRWIGPLMPAPSHFCTSATDILPAPANNDGMAAFKFLDWLVVEIETSGGLIGIGNAALAPHAAKSVIDRNLAHLLIGENPLDYEYLWQVMYRSTLPFGRKGIGMVAISAVDIAIWDLIGKIHRQPVFRLLGGRTKSQVPVYASKLYSQPIEEMQREAESYAAAGYKAVKFRFGWGAKDGAEGMQRNIALAHAVREAVGNDIDVMADAYMGWTLDYARRILPRLAPFNLRWIEEPLVADDIAGYAELKAMNIIPIAGGEHEYTLYGFRELFERHAIDVAQFDTNRVGGITQAQKICALADAFSVPVIPHAGQMHNYHIVMANVGAPMAEFFPKCPVEIGNELFWYIFDGEPQAANGSIDLADDMPGLGLTISDAHADYFAIID